MEKIQLTTIQKLKYYSLSILFFIPVVLHELGSIAHFLGNDTVFQSFGFYLLTIFGLVGAIINFIVRKRQLRFDVNYFTMSDETFERTIYAAASALGWKNVDITNPLHVQYLEKEGLTHITIIKDNVTVYINSINNPNNIFNITFRPLNKRNIINVLKYLNAAEDGKDFTNHNVINKSTYSVFKNGRRVRNTYTFFERIMSYIFSLIFTAFFLGMLYDRNVTGILFCLPIMYLIWEFIMDEIAVMKS